MLDRAARLVFESGRPIARVANGVAFDAVSGGGGTGVLDAGRDAWKAGSVARGVDSLIVLGGSAHPERSCDHADGSGSTA